MQADFCSASCWGKKASVRLVRLLPVPRQSLSASPCVQSQVAEGTQMLNFYAHLHIRF